MKKSHTSIDVLYQDIIHLEKAVSDLGRQVERVHRVVRIDERESAVAESRSRSELIEAVSSNTDAVHGLLAALHTEQELDGYYWREKRRRTTEAGKRTEHVRSLAKAKKKVGGVCSCGKHKGIQFLDREGNILEERCPVSWWVSLSRLAYEDEKLDAFLKSTPLEKYIRLYKLK